MRCAIMKVQFMYLTFFGIFGLAPFKIRVTKNHRLKFFRSKIGILYVVFLILLIVGLSSLYFWTMHYTRVPNESSTTRKIRISMKVAGAVTIVIIWANYCLKHSKMIKTANTFMLMNTKMVYTNEINKSWKKYSVFYILVFLHLILNAGNLYTSYLSYQERFDIRMLTNVFDFVICLHILQYAIILGIIRIKFEELRLKLSELSNDYGIERYVTFVTVKKNNTTLLKVSTIRQGYAVLLDVCDDVSKFYGSSILFSLTYAFGVTVYYSYYALTHSMISAEKSWIDTIDAILPLISVVIAVTAICILANNVTDQVCYFFNFHTPKINNFFLYRC
ncbi:uncharacterized protein LOC123263840 [Cotesia glomerata]|uniref:uncharacterized protein LOC123263840 n=1 Tax=Cotesia glomerata TaxID=32391 RepID=UPI001D010E9B|nr:uncharacterized protein LOC123263840 [Cotesia glomerata]